MCSPVPSSQKHVNFASPPAVPISPASYPSSPESTRQSPGYHHVQLHLPGSSYDGLGESDDPFREEALDDADDRAIQQAMQNARLNNSVSAATRTTASQANIRDTLSRFASAPKRMVEKQEDQAAAGRKPAMDVNAFTKMLMGGQSANAEQSAPSTNRQPADSASSTDTTTASQRSTIETHHTSADEADSSTSASSDAERDGRKPPPPPRTRHGRPLNDAKKPLDSDIPSSTAETPPKAISSKMQQPPTVPSQPTDSTDRQTSRKPPPPPLARRKSQKQQQPTVRPELERSGTSRSSLTSEPEEVAMAIPSPGPYTSTNNSTGGSNAPARMAPPTPPPSRRPNSQYGRRPSSDLPATYEQSDEDEEQDMPETTAGGAPSLLERAPSHSATTNNNKRYSQASLGPPPPVPPPRKNRGSGRSSMDSLQRPSAAALGFVGDRERGADSARSSVDIDVVRAEKENGRSVSLGGSGSGSGNVSNAADILADLEALQREVDAARASAGR
jgi:hypothetical protein